MKEFILKLAENELPLLIDLIHNSAPKTTFGVISQFIAKLDGQIKDQATPAEEPAEEPANQNSN
jgi:hypothetical protein